VGIGLVFFWSTSCNGETTINAEAYCLTLRELTRAIIKTQKKLVMLTKEIVVLHDNARPHAVGMTRNLLDSFGSDVLDHPQYSPDLTPSVNHPFLHLKQQLSGKRYNDDDNMKTEGNSWLVQQAASSYVEVTLKLVER